MKNKIQADLNQALKGKNELVVSTLRLLLSEIHNREIEKQAELVEGDIVEVIQKEVKKRKESIEAYQKGKRSDLVEKEKQELSILNKYLPQPLPPQELKNTIQTVIKEIGATGPADFSKIMGEVMTKVKGRAEGKVVSEAVKKALSE